MSSLDGATGFKLNGAAAYDFSGYSVASAGDVNGDGFADVIVGANADAHGTFGTASGVRRRRALPPTSISRRSTAPPASSSAARRTVTSVGGSVASAGDVNGDGFADLIVGAIGNDSSFTNAGASYVVFGKASGFAATIDLASLDGSTGFKLSGVAADDAVAARWLRPADINGDGFADVIVGAYYADPHGIASAGASYVVFGKASGFAANIDALLPRRHQRLRAQRRSDKRQERPVGGLGRRRQRRRLR